MAEAHAIDGVEGLGAWPWNWWRREKTAARELQFLCASLWQLLLRAERGQPRTLLLYDPHSVSAPALMAVAMLIFGIAHRGQPLRQCLEEVTSRGKELKMEMLRGEVQIVFKSNWFCAGRSDLDGTHKGYSSHFRRPSVM